MITEGLYHVRPEPIEPAPFCDRCFGYHAWNAGCPDNWDEDDEPEPTWQDDVRRAVYAYCAFAPNSHLGDQTRREDIRSSFFVIRSRLNRGLPIQQACGELETIAYSMADM